MYIISFIQGDAFSFMKLSALIITELKNLSAASRMQQQQATATSTAATGAADPTHAISASMKMS